MKYFYFIIMVVFLGLCFCSDNYYTFINPPVNPIDTTIKCGIYVSYSMGIRESTFKGFRNGTNFSIDTFPPGEFNGIIIDGLLDSGSLRCDSISRYWLLLVGKVWQCTTMCYYGPDTARWLDTFYFQYNIVGIEE